MRAAAILCVLLCHSTLVWGHVKWFSPYDTSEAPLPPTSVIAIPGFWLILLVSIEFIYFMVYLDAGSARLKQEINRFRQKLIHHLPVDFAYRSLMLALIVFFSCVWTIGDVILTPELKHESSFVSAIQVGMLMTLMTKRSAKFAGIGIFALWFYAMNYYGLFHLADYIIFIGIAVFLIIGAQDKNKEVSGISFLILYVSISWTLQWASIEKWVYPDWSYPLLEEKPHIAMGCTKEMFMVMAGFAEFTLAFLLIALTGIGFLITTLSLASVFVLAIIDFGKIDAIGHLAIIVCLVLMAIQGPSKINIWFECLDKDPVRRAMKITTAYCVALLFFTVIYYSMYHLSN